MDGPVCRRAGSRAHWPGQQGCRRCRTYGRDLRNGRATGRRATAGHQHDEEKRVPRHEHRSEEHTSELQSLMRISYAVFCLKKKKNYIKTPRHTTTIYKITYIPMTSHTYHNTHTNKLRTYTPNIHHTTL